MFWNGHLGTVIPGDTSSGTSGIPAPLSLNDRNTDDGDQDGAFASSIPKDATTLVGANIRFRYQPTFHISPSMRIKATMDVLDNLVLGSTPDFSPNLSRPDVPLVAFAGGAAPPQAGVNGFSDGLRIKEAYAEWQPAFLIRAGRMASHWGLGILANGGSGIDDDYGDYADRVLLALKLYDVYIVTAYDFVFSGAISADPNEFFGQPKDLGVDDDVKQFVVSVFQRPVSEQEKLKREVELREEFKPVFDWGVYFVGRFQEFDLTSQGYTDFTEDGFNDYDRMELMPRDAWAVVPDIWLRFQKRFDYFSGIRVEMEMAGVFGEIGRAVEDTGDATPARTIQQMAAALEVEYDRKELTIGLDTGVASGDSAEGFGVLDNATIGQGAEPNREVTNFKFDRNYHVDLLLFREVIGTVTNAWYIKPYIAYDLFDSVEDALGARIDLLYGHALNPSATPGNSGSLGFEADVRLFYEEKGRFNFEVEGGVLVPFDAFKYVDAAGNTTRPEVAVSVQTRLTLQF